VVGRLVYAADGRKDTRREAIERHPSFQVLNWPQQYQARGLSMVVSLLLPLISPSVGLHAAQRVD